MRDMRGIMRASRDCPQGVKGLPWQRMPQAETVPIDVYIVDTLMRDLVGHDRQPSAYLVYVFLWHETHGKKKSTCRWR